MIMRIIILFFPLFIFTASFAQSRAELSKKVGEYYQAGDYDKAITFSRQLVKVSEKELGNKHAEYSIAVHDLGLLLSITGQHEEAITWLKISLAIRKDIVGEAHPDYLNGMMDLANAYKALASYTEALAIMKDVVNTWRLLEGENSESFLRVAKEYGLTLITSGDFRGAEIVLLNLERVQRKVYGPAHFELAVTSSGLGILYLHMARFELSEPYLLFALRYYESNGSASDIAISHSNLGFLYFSIGQYERSEEAYLLSQRLQREVGDTLSNQYATLLGNMGVLYVELEKYQEALTCFLESSSIREKVFGTEHSEYAITLQNLSGVYFYLEQLDRVEPLLKEVIRIYKKTVGENHPEYASSLTNLASYYFRKKEMDKAEPLLDEALGIRRQLFGELHPDYAASLRNLALLNMGKKLPANAQQYFLQQNESISRFLSTTFGFLPEKEREDYLQNVFVLDDNSSFLTQYPGASSLMLRSSLEQVLFLKSLSLSGAQEMLRALRNTTDSGTARLFEQWLEKKKALALIVTGGEGDEEVIRGLEKECNRLEKDLMQRSAAFGESRQQKTVTMKELQAGMKDDEVVIEFVRYDYYLDDWTDSVFYGAYVLHKNDTTPRFVYLFEERQLQVLFDSAGASPVEQAFSLYRGLEKKKGNEHGVIGEQLYNLLWKPLIPFLGTKKQVSYSPSGLLYNIAIHALPVDSQSLLLDSYTFRQFTSTRLVANRTKEISKSRSSKIVLFGNPKFDFPGEGDKPGEMSLTAPGKRGGREKWDPLPGTAEELSKIASLFRQKGQEAIGFSGEHATEEAFRQLGGQSPRILHVATHGFFLPAQGKKKDKAGLFPGNSFAEAENPLVRSGLVFAYANHAWRGQRLEQGEDGIATAYEISQLDLSNTELVVLSACETGLGDVRGSEGVFGLQRAFKMAGVRKMIVSLWQVPDKETAELMTIFYTHLLAGDDIETAFARAREEMRKKYAPFYWAAFVLVE